MGLKKNYILLYNQIDQGISVPVPLPIRKINRKISLLFHYFEDIKNHTENLFCTGNINNLEETMDVKFENNTIYLN